MKSIRFELRLRYALPGLLGAGFGLGLFAVVAIADQSGPIQECEEHLKKIHQALTAYQAEYGKLPPQLSALFPKYLPDRAVLHCPADSSPGEPGRPYAHKDPNPPVSYSYEFSADESNGLPTPQGPFPKPDVGNSWGSWYLVSTHQRTFFGDQVPVVRCFHHKPVDSDEETVLNLTLEGKIYPSAVQWENHPDTVAVALKLMERDLAAGAEHFKQRRYLGRFEEYTYGWSDDPRIGPLTNQLCAVAAQLDRLSHGQPSEERSYTLRVEARLLNAARHFQATIPVAQESIQLLETLPASKPGQGGPFASAHGESEMLILADAYEGLGQYDKSIPLFQAFLEKTPQRRYLMGRLAKAYAASGQGRLASEWELKADPGKGLIGQAAPDFSLNTPAGDTVRLRDLLRNRKAVLVNFWFYGCHPCRVEFPQLQKIYEKLHGAGFEMVAINQGDPADRITGYLKENHFSFPVAMNGKDARDAAKRYRVEAYPTNFLLDPQGKILWRSEGFDEEGLRGALAGLDIDLK